MTNRLLTFCMAIGMVTMAWGSVRMDVRDFGVSPGKGDATAGVARLLEKARTCEDGVEIVFPKGTYHFYPAEASVYELYLSNHDQPVQHRVGLPLVGMKGCTVNAQGARFVFHGSMLPILIKDSEDTTCRGFSVSYATPFSAEGRIVKTDKAYTVLEFDPKVNPPWKVEDNKFVLNGENGTHQPNSAIAFRKDGMIVPNGLRGDIFWNCTAKQISPTQVKFEFYAARYGYAKTDTLVLRNATRPHPAMALYRARNTLVEDVVFHDSQGMALLAQRSEGIHIKGGGCRCAKGRKHSVSADACHFSNCRGQILVEDALFEGMMDDAINVHATSMRIDRIGRDRRTVTLRFCHNQAFGFEIFRPGERLRYIHADTLENVDTCAGVEDVRILSPAVIELTLDAPVPQDIVAGDAVENADWHPSVIFRNNTVRNNRARGALFTTPQPVLVEGNKFIHSSGSAILLAGDAAGWYESGACRDVIIRNNVFDHNLTCIYQFTEGIISICPEVSEPEKQTQRYHRNIRIEGNTFITHRAPLLYATSAQNVHMQGNKVKYDNRFTPMFKGVPYRIEHCDDMHLQEP